MLRVVATRFLKLVGVITLPNLSLRKIYNLAAADCAVNEAGNTDPEGE